jgi:hypothetical protein
MLRMWRAFVFPALCHECGFVCGLGYQDAAIHSGNLYRFDGWVRLATSRSGTDPQERPPQGRLGLARRGRQATSARRERVTANSILGAVDGDRVSAFADRESFSL